MKTTKNAVYQQPQAAGKTVLIPVLLCAAMEAGANNLPAATYDGHYETLDLLSSSAALEEEIDRLADELTPHDLRLAEPLLDFGRMMQEMDMHEEAAHSFEKALHIFRVNHGLYDNRQLEVVDGLLESREALAEWKEVDNLQHFRFHLARQQIPADTETRLNALMELTLWKLHAARHGLLSDPLHDTHEAAQLHRSELRELPQDAPPEKVAQLYLGIADLELTQAQHKASMPGGLSNGLGFAIPVFGNHGRLVLQEDELHAPTLVETLEHGFDYDEYPLDLFDIGRHLHEYKSSIFKAHSLVNHERPGALHSHEINSSIRQSIDDYNGFVAKVIFGKF